MDYKDMSTAELLELERDMTISDEEGSKIWEELVGRSPFNYYEEQMRETEQRFRKIEKQLDEIGNLVMVNHKLNTIISMLEEYKKALGVGRPPKCPYTK